MRRFTIFIAAAALILPISVALAADRLQPKEFCHSLEAIIVSAIHGDLSRLRGRQLSNRVWKAKIGITGFDKAAILTDEGDPQRNFRHVSSLMNRGDPAKTDQAYGDLVLRVEECLRIDIGINSKVAGGRWERYALGDIRKLKLVYFKHDKSKVIVDVFREPTHRSGDGRITVWTFYIGVSEEPK